MQISKAEASTYTCKELVKIVDDYIQKNWVAFNQFAREFGIKESIRILEEMNRESGKYQESYFWLITTSCLTGAPGTGKTYLAKKWLMRWRQYARSCSFIPPTITLTSWKVCAP